MNELSKDDIEAVYGGNPVLLGVIGGIAGNYLYDAMGGREGINSAVSHLAGVITDSVVDAWENDPVLSWLRDL